jgi:hypothetical protein
MIKTLLSLLGLREPEILFVDAESVNIADLKYELNLKDLGHYIVVPVSRQGLNSVSLAVTKL